MLLPSDFQRFKLGCHTDLVAPIIDRVGAEAPLHAYSRIMSTPRLLGGNDIHGSCVPTGVCNAIQTFAGRSGSDFLVPQQTPLDLYRMFGWNPNDPTTDKGMNPEDLFDYWLKKPIAGYGLKAYYRIPHKGDVAIRHAIEAGGVGLVLELSVAQQNQRVWMPSSGPDGEPGSWGGHFMFLDEFDGALTEGTSWGQFTPIDRSLFGTQYVVGAYQFDIYKI